MPHDDSASQKVVNSCLLNNLPLEKRRVMFETILDDLGKRLGTRDAEQILAEAYREYHGSYPTKEWLEKEKKQLVDYHLPYSATYTHLKWFGNPAEAEQSMLTRL